jgi:hypothetical protein
MTAKYTTKQPFMRRRQCSAPPPFWFVYELLLPNIEFDDVTIRIADVHLYDPITTRARSTYKHGIMGLQVLASFFQVRDLECEMRDVANREFFGAVSTGLYLGSASRFIFANQVYLSASPTKPGAREVKTARARNFLHAENLNIKAPRALYIFDKQRYVVQFANLHRHILLGILLLLKRPFT